MSPIGRGPLLGLAVVTGQECSSSLQGMDGLQCRTDDSAVITSMTVSTEDECCTACSNREDCGAFTLTSGSYSGSTCTLKTHCKEVMKAGGSRRRPSTATS